VLTPYVLLLDLPNMENQQKDVDQSQYIDNAIRAVREKKPLPEIDFTLHTMEDGNQVSTQERVCKGTLNLSAVASFPAMISGFATF
jgi:hypothetical protein